MFISPHLVHLANIQSAQEQALSQSPLAAYFSSISAMSGTMAPARGAARAGAEAVGYISRRTLATIDSANRISRCRTPKDLLEEQTRFWNVAMQQYVEASARMMAAWGQATAVPVEAAPAPIVTRATDRRTQSHDVISLQDTKSVQRGLRSKTDRDTVPDRDREAA